MLDEESDNELKELKNFTRLTKSKLIREAIRDLYLKEKRARESLLIYVNLYNQNVITKDFLFLLLPKKDAEAIIIGSKTGKEAAEVVKKLGG